MVEIRRQAREFAIQPIGVVRAQQAGQSIAEAVVSGADQIYRRSYEAARDQAVDRGGKLAAETDPNLITQFDPNTKLPLAMELTQSMGRFSKDAFEKVTLQRFEQAISDDIQSTKAIMMEKYQDSPKSFEAAFSQYLEGTGANTSGYYKQVVVDRGASALEEGRTRLQIAQMARIRAEAAAAKAKAEDDYIAKMLDLGATGGGMSFDEANRATAVVSNHHQDHVDAGIVPPSKNPEFLKKARAAYISGRLSSVLNDPSVAVEAGAIQLYMQSGGSKAMYELLGPKARGVVAEFETLYGIDAPSELMEFAAGNKGIFAVSEAVGTAIYNRQTALRDAGIEANKASATSIDTNLTFLINSNFLDGVGNWGNATQIIQQRNQLRSALDGLDPNVIGRDAYNSIQNKIEDAENQLNAGLVRQMAQMLDKRDPSGNQLSIFAEALESNNQSVLADLIPSLQYKILASGVAGNGSTLGTIARSWKQGGDVLRTEEQTLQEISFTDQVTAIKAMFGDNTVPFDQKQALYNSFRDKTSKVSDPNVVKFIQSIEGDLSSKFTTLQNQERERLFSVDAAVINRNTTAADFVSSVKALNASAALNGVAGTTPHINAAKDMANSAAIDFALKASSIYPDPAIRAQQLRAMSIYAKDGVVTGGLTPESKKIIDDAKGISADVAGSPVGPDGSKLSEQLSSVSSSITTEQDMLSKIQQDQVNQLNLVHGIYIGTSSDEVSKVIATAVGLVALPPDIFERPAATREEAEAVNLAALNRGAVPQELLTSANKLISGAMPPENIQQFLGYARAFMFSIDSTGKQYMNSGMAAALGENASRLEAILIAAELAPIGQEPSYVSNVGKALEKPMSDDLFKELTGYDNPAQLVANTGASSQLMDELVPLARALAPLYKSRTEEILTEAINKRYIENKNSYDPTTGGSSVRHDPSSFGIDVKMFEKGVEDIVAKIKSISNPLYFEAGSSISVEDLQSDPKYFPLQILDDTFGNVTEAQANLSQAKRVIYGPTPNSNVTRPEWQLYAVDAGGFVSPIPNSAFTINTIEMAIALGQLLPPAPPELPAVEGIISGQTIGSQLTEQEAAEVAAQIPRVRTPYSEAKPQMPSTMQISIDQGLIGSVTSLLGKNSEAAQIMPSIADAASRSTGVASDQIRKVIREMSGLRPSPRRDEVISQLRELHGKLKGMN